MKKFFNLTILFVIVLFTMAATPKGNAKKPLTYVTLSLQNGTNYSGYIYLNGTPYPYSAGTVTSFQIYTGSYYVTIYNDQPGTRTYIFGSQQKSNSNGSESFSAYVSGDVSAAIY